MDLGLSGVEWKDLARRVGRILHLASTYFVGVERSVVAAVNLRGTEEILELARACTDLGRLVHFSTTQVSGDRRGLVLEEELEAGQGFRNHYEETKFRAERLVRRAGESLPVTILRPAVLVGDSKTGEIERLDGPYHLVRMIVASPLDVAPPLPARGDAPLHLVPIDYVIEAAHAIVARTDSIGRTYHLVDPNPLPARQAFEKVAEAAGRRLPRGFVPAALSRMLFRTPGLERFVQSPLAFVETLATDVDYSDRNTREALRGTGIVCPSFESYAPTLVKYVQERLRSEREARKPGASEPPDPLL
jgi:thioester reductase-like protein